MKYLYLLLVTNLFDTLGGTNFGSKHSSISTHPGLWLDSSTMILSVQSDKHVKKTYSKVIKHYIRHCSNYWGEIHYKLTRMASSMMPNIIALMERYECIRVSETEWMVRKKCYFGTTIENGYPRFWYLSESVNQTYL